MLNTLMVQSRKNGAVHMAYDPNELLTTAEAAEIIGVTPQHVQALCRNEIIPSKRLGERAFMLRREDVEYYRDHRPKRGKKSKSLA